jgi:hypothetical protein
MPWRVERRVEFGFQMGEVVTNKIDDFGSYDSPEKTPAEV